MAGAIFYLVFATAWAIGAYWLWPDGVTDIPLSALTLGALLRACGAVFMSIAALGCIVGAITDAFDN
jgi:hypothetical protein